MITKQDFLDSGWKQSKKYPDDMKKKNCILAFNEEGQIAVYYHKKKKNLKVYKLIGNPENVLFVLIFKWQF